MPTRQHIAFIAVVVWILLWSMHAYAELPGYDMGRCDPAAMIETGFFLAPLMFCVHRHQDTDGCNGQAKPVTPCDGACDHEDCSERDPESKYTFITKKEASGKMFYYAQHLRGSNLTMMIGMRDLDSGVMQVPDQLYTGGHSTLLGDELDGEEVKLYAEVLKAGLHAHLLHIRETVADQCKHTLRQLESGSQFISRINNTFIDVIPGLIGLELEIERQE